MKLRTIENLDVRGKFVLLRDDFNVQIVDGKITDAFRIEQSMPTINALRAGGAKIAICAHLGRPKGYAQHGIFNAPCCRIYGRAIDCRLLGQRIYDNHA